MNRGTWLLMLVLAGTATGHGRAWAQEGTEDQAGELRGDALPDAAAGMALYREHCESCHGPDGRGRGSMSDRLPAPPPNFADPDFVGRSRPVEALTVIRDGRLDKLMPPWKDSLSPAEREAALYAAWSFSYSPDRLLTAGTAWQEACASCHSGEGLTTAPEQTALSRSWWQTRSLDDARAAFARATAHSGITPTTATLTDALTHARSFSFRPLIPEGLTAEGSISGRVVNRSAGSAGARDAVVSLVPFHDAVPGVLPSRPLTQTVASDGSFKFQGLLAGQGMRYHLVTHYRGADAIQPQPVNLGGTSPLRAVQDTEVWEPDPNAPARVTLAQWVLAPRPEEGLIHVVEAWSLANDSDRALVGAEGRPTLSFRLPPTARDLSFEDPSLQALAQVEEGQVSFTQPWAPGSREVLFSYALPYAGGALGLTFAAPLATERFDLLVVDASTDIEGPKLGPTRRETRQERPVSISSAEGLPAGELALRLVGLPEPSGEGPPAAVRLREWGPSMDLGSYLGLGLTALAALVLLLGRTRVAAATAAKRAFAREAQAAARLDAAFASGELPAAEYRQRRAEIMAAVLQLPAGTTRAGAAPTDDEGLAT